MPQDSAVSSVPAPPWCTSPAEYGSTAGKDTQPVVCTSGGSGRRLTDASGPDQDDVEVAARRGAEHGAHQPVPSRLVDGAAGDDQPRAAAVVLRREPPTGPAGTKRIGRPWPPGTRLAGAVEIRPAGGGSGPPPEAAATAARCSSGSNSECSTTT